MEAKEKVDDAQRAKAIVWKSDSDFYYVTNWKGGTGYDGVQYLWRDGTWRGSACEFGAPRTPARFMHGHYRSLDEALSIVRLHKYTEVITNSARSTSAGGRDE